MQKKQLIDHQVGISGFSSHIPPYKIDLSDWCKWRANDWNKIRTVVGSSFRMRGPNENAYTMAATAVLRLIEQYKIDPSRIGYLALGTESSTDNSAGAIIVKGMVDKALAIKGKTPINRECEVPEFKQACLGGMYAMKAAARYLMLDGQDKIGIVVCSDIAEYELYSSGEATQGAGAIATLLETNPKLLNLELDCSGSSSDYRGPDFRKPFFRFMQQIPGSYGQPRDFPIFNGKYSTICYIDAVLTALRSMFNKIDVEPIDFIRNTAATFLHRPYQRMAETGLIMTYFLALALGNSPEEYYELHRYAESGNATAQELKEELLGTNSISTDFMDYGVTNQTFSRSLQAAQHFRDSEEFSRLMTSLGLEQMKQVGNLYTASLPSWIAAGLEEAVSKKIQLEGQRILTIGYGSGDAAEIMPMTIAREWEVASNQIKFEEGLRNYRNVDQQTYAALHKGEITELELVKQSEVFYIQKIGSRSKSFDDLGMEYYEFS
mgnify:CR=1 FL=1